MTPQELLNEIRKGDEENGIYKFAILDREAVGLIQKAVDDAVRD